MIAQQCRICKVTMKAKNHLLRHMVNAHIATQHPETKQAIKEAVAEIERLEKARYEAVTKLRMEIGYIW